MNMLTDLGGYIRRNAKNWNASQLRKCLNEVKSIHDFLERKLKEVA